MERLTFNELKRGMKVLYVLEKNIHAIKVVATTHGHPSVPLVRLTGGFTLHYNKQLHDVYADNAVNRTEILLENVKILTGVIE